MFGFQRLDVYRCSVQFLALAVEHAGHAPRGFSTLPDQLRRAALSILRDIAEGTGKGERNAARFYMIAGGSALECAAILDVLETLGALASEELTPGRELLERIGSMLTKLRKA
jgi:four helix bundle protein